jgi:flagellar biosynthesis/type III secretory pathway M-ring protein FliF/YscJ
VQNNTATGISANTVETNNVAGGAGPVNNSKTHTSDSTIDYEIGNTTTISTQAPGGLKRLTAAITVATQMQGTGADRKSVPRTPEEIEKLRRIVSSALGADPTRGDIVALEEMPFNDQFATDITQQLDQQSKRDYWMNLARSLLYPALGLGALFILMRTFKTTSVPEIPIGVPVGRLGHKTNGTGNGHGNGHNRFGDFSFEPQPGVVTVDVLNKLIKDNPNNMTQAIREWMNRGHTTPEPESNDRR